MNKEVLHKIIKEIEGKKAQDNFPVKIIAIDGHGGAGKSTLARQLAKEFNAEVLHTDDFASWNKPPDWWKRIVDEIFEPIKAGAKTLNYECGSWAPDHHPVPVKDQPVTPIMFLEGVSSARKEFRPYLTYVIWVETPIELCLKRGLERDGKDMLENWQKWFAEEDEYIVRDNPIEYSDIKVSGAGKE
jgi:uridine kinase